MHLMYTLFFLFAAGVGQTFLIHNPTVEQCAQADINKLNIIPTKDCTFNDPHQVWVWTPGNLLMNVHTSTCLQTKETQTNRYLPMTVTQCNSSDLGQKWRCDESRLLWGISFDSPNITHAVRYNGNKALKARSVKILVSSGNTWTVFPTNNQSVCSASHNEGNKIQSVSIVSITSFKGIASSAGKSMAFQTAEFR